MLKNYRLYFVLGLLLLQTALAWSLPRGKVFYLNGKHSIAEVLKGQRIYLEYDARYSDATSFQLEVYRLHLNGTIDYLVRSLSFSRPYGRFLLRGLPLESGFYGVKGFAVKPDGTKVSYGDVSVTYDPRLACLMLWKYHKEQETKDSGFNPIPPPAKPDDLIHEVVIVQEDYKAGDHVEVSLKTTGADGRHSAEVQQAHFRVEGRAMITRQTGRSANLVLDRSEVPYSIFVEVTDDTGRVWSREFDIPVTTD